ncbi:MAG: alpha/beta hydrolase [Trueperaceae bacterium]|nr:alpha/beta hydrolase [Trueperaceae bacterium]
MKLILGIVISLLSLTFAQTELRPKDCPRQLMLSETEGETAFCQSLIVPEDWANPAEKTLELAVLTLKAKTEAPKPDPIIFLQGGPGGAALSTIEFWQELSWRDSRDIILIDQRGTGYGKPNLKCPELYQNLDDFKQGASDCRERLTTSGNNVDLFNSAQNAQDIGAFIRVAGLESVNLYGVSYGTRLALTIMRDTPEKLRTVVLDSTYPPQAQRLNEFGANFARALSEVFFQCDRDPVCKETYPDLKERFFNRLDRLDLTPLRQPITALEFSKDDVLNILFQGMYSESVISSLPYALDKLSQLDLNSFIVIVAGMASAEDLDTGNFGFRDIWQGLGEVFKYIWREVQSEGVYFATECPEDVFFQNYRLVKRANEGLEPILQDFANATALEMFTACRAWQAPRGVELESKAVVSDIPTLVLAGSFDPITPPEWGERAAKTLSQSYFYEFPNAAHGVFLSSDCPVQMVEAFFDEPGTAPDATCIEGLEVKFYVPQ